MPGSGLNPPVGAVRASQIIVLVSIEDQVRLLREQQPF
jgi:hypothetical protein